MTEQTIDRTEYERAILTTRRFLVELQQHADPETCRLALLAVAVEASEIEHGREVLSCWLAELSKRLNAEVHQDNTAH